MKDALLVARAAPLPLRSLNLLLLVLCVVIVVVVSFFLFYFNRLVAWVFQFLIRCFFWRSNNVWVECEGLQLSLLAGRIFIKDFRYHSRNQSVRVLKCHITWRYWLWRTQSVLNGSENDGDGEQAHKSEKALALPCRLHAGLEGVEVFFYNRTPAYDEIIRQFEPPAGEGATDANVRGSSSEETAARPRGISLDDPQVRKSTRATVQTHETPQPSTGRWTRFLGPIRRAYASVREWMRGVKPSFDWNDVLPVSFEATTCAIIAGNNSTPSILIADIQKVTGTYGITQCRSSYDLYKNVYQLHLSSVKLITRTNPDYEVPMLERGQKIHAELERSCPESIQHSGFLRFDAFRRLVRFSYNIIHKATPKPPPKWRGLARYMTDAQRREAGELTHEVEYGKVTTLLETPALEATYYVDAAGLVPEDARNLGDTGREVVDVGNGDLAPEWAVELTLYGGTITYGPWADRQRDTLQRAFFPPTYVSRDPTARLSPGSYRLHTSLLIVLELRESVVLRLPTREPSKDWKYDGIAPLADTRKKKDKRPFGWLDVSIGPSSTLTYNMAMVADEAGYRNTLEVHLREPSVSSSVNGTLFWRNQACRVLCDMPSPLKWDGFRQWTFDITFMTPNLYILRDHTTLITDLISDWTSGPPSDFNTWVPTVYSFKFGLKDYTINLYVNDHNVIDHPLADDKNSLLVLSGSSANVHLNVPADKFRPAFRTTTFWVEIPTLQVGMSLPDWNTHYTFARERPMSLGTIGFLRLDSSYTSYPEVHPDHVEKFVLDIKARRALFKCHAWSIRHFLRLKDNYFGRFTHFSTLQEYMEKKSDGIIGDDILAKYRKGKSDVFEVCLSVNVSDSQVILPQEIHDCKAAVILSAPELQVFLRLNDYFLEMSLNIAPATLFATDDHMEVVKQTRLRRFKGGRILLGSIDIVANRLLGPQPETATYLCIWEIRLGSIRAILLPRLVWSLHAAARAFANNYPDALNAPDSGFELPLDPDMTFLKVVLPSADITLKDENTALHVVLPRGVSLDYNDVAGKTYRKVTSIHLPVADVKTLLRSPYKKDNWFEVASAKFDIHADIYSSPPGWEEDAARQLRFVTTQDSLTKRLRFLSGHGGQPGGRHFDQVYLPMFPTPGTQAPRRRHFVRQTNAPIPRHDDSESEGEALTEVERRARVIASRLLVPAYSEGSIGHPQSDESLSSGDESDNPVPTDSPSSSSEFEFDDSDVDDLDTKWPRFGHYYHILNRYRASLQDSLADSSPFVRTRDPIDTILWQPTPKSCSTFDYHDDDAVDDCPQACDDIRCEATSLFRLRTQKAVDLRVTPLIATAVRSLFASLEHCQTPLEGRLDELLSTYVSLVTSKMDHDAGNRNAFDILVPNLRLSLLQRVDEIQERTNNIAGAPTQLLTSSNLHISHFAFFISQAPATVVPSSSHTQSTPDSLISLQVKAINLHVHTATSHPRSKAFVPRTLLHAVLAPLNFALRTYEDTSGRLDIGCLRATLGGKSPELIASTFQSAIRFASKIATTATLTGRRERRRRQHMVHQILQFQPDKTVWVDPLSWTQTSFIVKSGLPSRLRSDLSWKILAHLRHRLRETNPSKVLDLQKLVESMDANIDPPPVADVSTLMAGQEWMDWTHDQEEESHRPVLLDMLYPASVVQRALNDVRHSGAFKFYLGRLRSVLADNEGAHTVIVAGPLWSRLQTGQRLLLTADPGTGDEAQSSVLHIFGSLRVDNCGVRVSPTFIPFLSDVLRVQRRAASPKVPKGVKKIKRLNSSPIGPMIIETTIEVGQARLEASALKVILDVRASGVRLVTNASVPAEITGSDYASCSVAVMTEEFRIGTKATPAGSKHAADQETLAEIVFSKPNTSILVREAELERNVNIVVWLSQALIHVPRSALKLYHFSREWRQEYTSKYDIMVRDLLTEIEKTGGRPAPSQPRTRKATIFRTQASLKRLQMLLQVMHGTWVSWTFLDSIIFMEGHDGSTLSHSFGVDLKSQTVDITSQAGESTPLTPSSSAIRLPLPRFTISGKYGQDGMQCSSTLGFFSIRLKPQYVDDILVVQQKFGSDFNDLLDLYTQKRDDSPLSSSQPVPRTGPTTPMTVTVQLQGFSISLEGPSSTQYLNAAVIDGTVVNRPGEGVTWDARASSLSLSLAHHSAPHATRSSFNRKFRSAYMDVEFYADNVRPRGTPSTEKHFNLRVIRIHAVMQPAAFGELGDLVDYVQAEMLLRKEQRSVELAEIRKKGKLLRTKLERETSTTKEQEESWLDERVVMIEVRSVGVAFPLSTDDNFMPSHTPLETTIPFVPSSVRAFLFSVRSIRFSAQKYEKGDMDVEDFSFQFVPDFDQSIAVHFEGDTHQTHNRLLLPSMKAAVQSELDGQSRRILAVANVNGLILDLDTSITGYVFSLIDVYRQGKERIERLAPGQARANIEALSARFASAQAEQSSIAVLSTNFLAKLDFHSGRVRLFAPESSRMDPHTRLLFRESSMIDPLSALSDVGTETSIDTIVLPRLSVDADFTGASASEKFSASEAAALSYLRISAVVYTSKNTIWPSVLPFLVEVVRNIERRMDEPHVSPVHVQPVASTPVEPLATSSTNIIPVAESVIGSQLHVQFTLKVDASHLALTCQPDVNVVAALEWQSSQILVTIEPITHEVKLVGTIGGIKASLRHEYLRESSVTAEARDLTFSIAMGRILQGPDTNYVPSLSISLKTELLGRLRFSRLQDLLCFKAVWLDRIPVFEPRARAEAPPTPLAPPIKAPSSSEPQPRSGIVIVVIAVVKTVDLEVDLGHAITNLRLELQDLIVRRYQNRETSTLSLSIGPVALSATRSLSGELTMPQFEFKTERQINRNRTEDGLHVNQLVVQINTGDIDLHVRYDEFKLLGFHADPIEAKVWDDWTNLPNEDHGLRLDFSLSGGKIQVIGTMQAASYLISTAAKVKAVLRAQQEGAARESRAFRTTLHPKPANPLSDVAAAMLTSARSRFQEAEEYDFTIIQQMRCTIAHIRLELVDGGRTYDMHANTIVAVLERFVRTQDDAPQRDLQLVLGSFTVRSFPALPGLDLNAIPANPTNIFLFPQVNLHMKSTLHLDTQLLDYEFESAFPLQLGKNVGNEIYFILDAVEYFQLHGRWKDLKSRVTEALTDPIFQEKDNDWWNQPIRSNSLGESILSREGGSGSGSGSGLALSQIPEPAAGSSARPSTLTYHSIRTQIETPRFRQLHQSQITNDTFLSLTGINVKENLPCWVHEYATVPIESIMKLLLRIYAQRLRKGEAFVETVSAPRGHAPPPEAFPFPPLAPGSPRGSLSWIINDRQ